MTIICYQCSGKGLIQAGGSYLSAVNQTDVSSPSLPKVSCPACRGTGQQNSFS